MSFFDDPQRAGKARLLFLSHTPVSKNQITGRLEFVIEATFFPGSEYSSLSVHDCDCAVVGEAPFAILKSDRVMGLPG